MRRLSSQIAATLEAARRINDMEGAHTRRNVPCDDTIGPGSTGELRYSVLVTVTNTATNEVEKWQTVLWGNRPLTTRDLQTMAIDRANRSQRNDSRSTDPRPILPAEAVEVQILAVGRRC